MSLIKGKEFFFFIRKYILVNNKAATKGNNVNFENNPKLKTKEYL